MSDKKPEIPTSGHMKGKNHYLPLRVYYEDTDAGGFVYHANYLKYMERGRTEFLRCCGIIHSDLASLERGFKFAVASFSLNYISPGFIDDALVVVSMPTAMKGATFHIDQEVRRSDQVLARASIRVACLDNNNRPRRIPKDVREKLSAFEG